MNQLYLTLRGFTFNNKHNHDAGVVMQDKSIQPPSKKKIKQSIPFMNGSYDFSTVGSNGEISYNEREITITLGLPTDSKERLQTAYSKALEWLQDVGKSQLIFDDSKDYYYLAEVEDASSFEQVMSYGKLTVKFVADPFKIGVNLEGSDVWDTFNFDEDVAQNVEFDVTGNATVNIINVGRLVSPTINASTSMTITVGGKTYNVVSGDNKLYGLKLQPGDNTITITGTGHIKFIFRKEVL
jgi:predicted phage tail component-like protein